MAAMRICFVALAVLFAVAAAQTAAPTNNLCMYPSGYMVGAGFDTTCANWNTPATPTPQPTFTITPQGPVPTFSNPCGTTATAADIITCQKELFGLNCQSLCPDSSLPLFDPVTFALTVTNFSQSTCDRIIAACDKVYTDPTCFYNSKYQYYPLKDFVSGGFKCSAVASPSDWPRVKFNDGPALTKYIEGIYIITVPAPVVAPVVPTPPATSTPAIAPVVATSTPAMATPSPVKSSPSGPTPTPTAKTTGPTPSPMVIASSTTPSPMATSMATSVPTPMATVPTPEPMIPTPPMVEPPTTASVMVVASSALVALFAIVALLF